VELTGLFGANRVPANLHQKQHFGPIRRYAFDPQQVSRVHPFEDLVGVESGGFDDGFAARGATAFAKEGLHPGDAGLAELLAEDRADAFDALNVAVALFLLSNDEGAEASFEISIRGLLFVGDGRREGERGGGTGSGGHSEGGSRLPGAGEFVTEAADAHAVLVAFLGDLLELTRVLVSRVLRGGELGSGGGEVTGEGLQLGREAG